MIDRLIARESPYLLENLTFHQIDVEKDTDLRLCILYEVVSNMKRVSEMKKRAKYQHLLIKVYDSSLFKTNLIKFECKTDQYERESKTLLVLTLLFNYAKFRLSQEKVNLEVWAMYPLMEYVAMSLSNTNRCDDSLFSDGVLMKDKVNETIMRLKKYKEASADIKYRLDKLLKFLCSAYNSEDDA